MIFQDMSMRSYKEMNSGQRSGRVLRPGDERQPRFPG